MEFSEESKKAAKDFFKRFDYNNDGTIYKRELYDALAAFGLDLDKKGMDFTRQHFDTDGDGEIQIEELVENLDVLIKYSVDGNKLSEAFKRLDLNGDGHIGSNELMKILTSPGPNCMKKTEANELVTELLAKYDVDKDKKFSYMEFVRMLIGEDSCSPPREIDRLVYNQQYTKK